jgi:hypothetical protein
MDDFQQVTYRGIVDFLLLTDGFQGKLKLLADALGSRDGPVGTTAEHRIWQGLFLSQKPAGPGGLSETFGS